MLKIILSLFLSGLFFGSGPCLASCGPLLISYVAGAKKQIVKSFLAYVLFSLARICVYLIVGGLIFSLGRFFTERALSGFSKYILWSGGVFIIGIGILTASGRSFESGICGFLQRKFLKTDKKSIILLGVVIGLLPCAPLLALFSYTGLVAKSWGQSILYNLSFGIGTFFSPLLPLVLVSGFLSKFINKQAVIYQRAFSFIAGIVIIYLGAQLLIRNI